MPLLHAQRGTAPGIYDAHGRQVILRGVSYNALGDYYQDDPDAPPVIKPRAGDMPLMASLGLNSVRLLISWSALEPQRGKFDQAYIARIRKQVERARQYGLYVVLDMHQDAWGKYIASREAGDVCVPPLEPAIGWDGAPAWATITDGLTTCRLQKREFSPAVVQAFTNFYLNRDGIQTQFIAAWKTLVRAFARYDNVAGYDLFNEPHPGYLPLVSGVVLQGDFYRRLIAAIRTTEQTTPGGQQHIVFFEPSILWSLLGNALTPLPTFTADRNLVFAPHSYCGSIALPKNIATCFRDAHNQAKAYGVTFWSGEWGWYGDPKQFAPKVVRFGRLEDNYLVGSAMWQFEQACGDPHTISTPGGKMPRQTIALKRTGCPGDVDLGLIAINAQVLSRPYPRAVPGRLKKIDSDAQTATLTVQGDTLVPGTANLWVPTRNAGPQVTGESIGKPRIDGVPGGYRIRVPVRGSYQIRVQ